MDFVYVDFIIKKIDQSHPTMRIGHPFKSRWGGRTSQGLLINPEMLKFKIPCPIAFVPLNQEKSPRHQMENPVKHQVVPRQQLISAGSVKVTPDCQKTVQNYNNCLKNNNGVGSMCDYYRHYLNNSCSA